MEDKYVPVAAATQSESGSKVKVTIPQNTLKIVLLAVVVAGVLYLLYKNFGPKKDKEKYETRSERMIAAARNNVKEKNNLANEDEFSDMTEFSDLTDLTEDMKEYENQKKNLSIESHNFKTLNHASIEKFCSYLIKKLY